MATQADVRRIALTLPDTGETKNHFAEVIAIRVASPFDKDFLLSLDPKQPASPRRRGSPRRRS